MDKMQICSLKWFILITMVVLSTTNSQTMKCTYGERGSLTSTCVNATPTFFRATSYRFDSLDETVRCVTCNLETIEPNTFDISGNQIINLDLTNSKIQNLKESSFVGLVFLKNLYLQSNKIKNIFPGVFKGIRKLEILNFQNNSISFLTTDGFKELANLTVLNLEYNSIKSMDVHAFRGLTSLKELNLAHNRITNIQDVFQTLTHISSINLEYNEINVIKTLDFANITTLYELNLANNNLDVLTNDIFLSFKSLQRLNISSNEISAMDPQAFRGLSNLERLDLGNNNLSSIVKGTFLGLTDLRDLVLSQNNLTVFKTGLFSGLPELRYLNLSHNEIVIIIRSGILPLHSLHTLDLSSNQLLDLDFKLMYQHMPRLTYLDLDNNLFPCYLIQEMVDYFENDNIKLSSDGILKNTTCKDRVRAAVKEAQVLEEQVMTETYGGSYASAYVVYTFLTIIMILICIIFFLQYRMDNYLKYYSGVSKSTSQVNLVSKDLHTHDDF